MTRLSVTPAARDDAAIAKMIDPFVRRVEATPPGTCPIAVMCSLLETSEAQTCGKCVPCRDGIPEITRMLHDVEACRADSQAIKNIRTLAQMVRDTSDCAIGYHAAQLVLDGLDSFAAEFESHVREHACQEGVGQTVPCETMCPAHVDVPGYLALTGNGDCAGAIALIRKDNPFPTACGYVCEHPCEQRCRRLFIDAPINIRGIKKYAVDNCPADSVATPQALPQTGHSIAVVGGGPSGMTCAYYLALMGHHVDVYESRAQLGGMMRYGIPAYRFPREKLDEDIRAILGAGDIDVHMNAAIDPQGMKDLARTHDAVYVAIGAQGGKSLDLPGTDARGVMSAVDLLTEIGDNKYPDFTGKNIVVIGGGNVAMDCARTSVRAGAQSVTVAYRRRIEDMTALDEEVQSAIAEGVEMMTLCAPDSIEVDETGAAQALICKPQKIGAVKRGRPAPVDADKPPLRLEADIILIAVGQAILSAPFEEFGMEVNRTQLCAGGDLVAPGFENVFVGGDCQHGPKTVIMAIGDGKVAARNIDEYLGYHHPLDCGVRAPLPDFNDRTPMGRVMVMERPARERKHDFLAVEAPMSKEEAIQECGRCLRCDHFGVGATEKGRVQYV